MPPSAVRTVGDLIYWQYAKIISESAGAGRRRYPFVMDRFKKLQSGEIEWSTAVREWVKEHEIRGLCAYCGSAAGLSVDHLLPRSRGGPDAADNAVLACRNCNSSKGDRGIYEWFGLEMRYEVPRIVEGKYLKLLHRLHGERGSLQAGRADLQALCRSCRMNGKCPSPDLTVYCLEGVFGA